MSDLTDFVMARVAEDEEVARAASRVRETQSGDSWQVARGRHGLDRIVHNGTQIAEANVEAAPHIARHNPARVLAECEAKRRIVTNAGQHAPGERGYGASNYAVQCVALPYAEHADYRPEWRP